MTDRATVPRGRHAPPLEVRLSVQRRRLLEAAAAEFARSGYAEASAEAIALPLAVIRATSCDGVNAKMIGRSNEPMRAVFDAPGVLVAPPGVAVPLHAEMRTIVASTHPSRPAVLRSMPSSLFVEASVS